MANGIDVVKDLYAAFRRGDVAAVLGAFDPAIEWNEAEGFLHADRNPYVGPQAVAEGRYTGVWRATGTPVNAQSAHVWHVRDGKVVRFQQHTDTGQWMKAAGR